ncbi:uncharacterized protein E0L32_009340 [Thyridium curvatum]|uniref:Major facilitator superfamily (MFS) profile domain-containing protein n=1 Tax=Thyridium curvatum TaxID=1093900 RepID=A0A507AJ92_9PEZI|nr:uncharacterized protein E0L32_009340 [Thyridium curvatum]TPX09452.1 hypothetical protein E0L32_009340 [Thyridium curvatum]
MASKKEQVHIAEEQAPEFETVRWSKDPGLRKLYFYAAVLMVASATTGYDGSLLNTSQMMTAWKDYFDHVEKDPNRLGLMTNMFNIGSIVSFFITPFIADRWGRKVPIAAGCLIMILGGFLTAFANGYAMYCGGRFTLGFGNSLAQMCSPMLLTEICHPQHRGPVTTIYNCLWNLGNLICTFIGWGTSYVASDWSWRSITLIQIVPSLIQIIFIFWIPESPRWLLSKDRNEEALAILAKYHANGNTQNATVQFEYREIGETIRMEAEAGNKSSYLDFFKTKGNRWRLAIIISIGVISQYSGNAVISNYMNAVYDGAGITDQNQKLGISSGKTVLDLGCAIGAALTVDRFGRRPLFLTAITGMTISFALWTVMAAMYDRDSNKPGFGYAQIVFVWIFGIFYDIGFSGLLVGYTLEVLPFHLRAKGMMIMNITVQAILALSAQTNLLAWENLPSHWNLCLFYTLWDFVELIFVYFVYVETNGPTLEEIAKIFDGEQAVAQINLEQVEKELALHENRETTYPAEKVA